MNKFETAIEILKDEFEGAKVASEDYTRMVIRLKKAETELAEAKDDIETFNAEYQAHTVELDEKIAELQQIIDSNEYKLRTVWYKGKAWASVHEVEAALRVETDRIRTRKSA